jgi:hypothetical protein
VKWLTEQQIRELAFQQATREVGAPEVIAPEPSLDGPPIAFAIGLEQSEVMQLRELFNRACRTWEPRDWSPLVRAIDAKLKELP